MQLVHLQIYHVMMVIGMVYKHHNCIGLLAVSLLWKLEWHLLDRAFQFLLRGLWVLHLLPGHMYPAFTLYLTLSLFPSLFLRIGRFPMSLIKLLVTCYSPPHYYNNPVIYETRDHGWQVSGKFSLFLHIFLFIKEFQVNPNTNSFLWVDMYCQHQQFSSAARKQNCIMLPMDIALWRLRHFVWWMQVLQWKRAATMISVTSLLSLYSVNHGMG